MLPWGTCTSLPCQLLRGVLRGEFADNSSLSCAEVCLVWLCLCPHPYEPESAPWIPALPYSVARLPLG